MMKFDNKSDSKALTEERLAEFENLDLHIPDDEHYAKFCDMQIVLVDEIRRLQQILATSVVLPSSVHEWEYVTFSTHHGWEDPEYYCKNCHATFKGKREDVPSGFCDPRDAEIIKLRTLIAKSLVLPEVDLSEKVVDGSYVCLVRLPKDGLLPMRKEEYQPFFVVQSFEHDNWRPTFQRLILRAWGAVAGDKGGIGEMIFLEVQRGCNRSGCSTRCPAYGAEVKSMPTDIANKLIDEFKTVGADIHLYGYGEVAGYPFGKLNVNGCKIALTNQSYYMAESLTLQGATVFSRVDSPEDADRVPGSDGYFSIAVRNIQLKKIAEKLSGKPFAVKSYGSHLPIKVKGLSLEEIIQTIGRPHKLLTYETPCKICKTSLVRYENGHILYYPCVSSDMARFIKYRSATAVIESQCSECYRYPNNKFVAYYEPLPVIKE